MLDRGLDRGPCDSILFVLLFPRGRTVHLNRSLGSNYMMKIEVVEENCTFFRSINNSK